MRCVRRFCVVGLLALAWGCTKPAEPEAVDRVQATPSIATANPFLVEPYLQWGNATIRESPSLEVMWQTDDVDARWAVEYSFGLEPWRKGDSPVMRRIAVSGVPAHRVYRDISRT